MGRVINTDGPGKRRNQLMRTCAELLRRLSQAEEVDQNCKNMLAMMVFCLREIADGIDESTVAWEKRGYWVKAEEFRERWRWPHDFSQRIMQLIYTEDWDAVPHVLIKLFPYFSDITVIKFTRKQSLWQDAHDRLLAEQAS
jgi:hypothetical protein